MTWAVRNVFLLACLAVVGCDFKGEPSSPGVYTCTIAGREITFDSRDYDWRANSSYAWGTHKRGGSRIVLRAGSGDCRRIAP